MAGPARPIDAISTRPRHGDTQLALSFAPLSITSPGRRGSAREWENLRKENRSRGRRNLSGDLASRQLEQANEFIGVSAGSSVGRVSASSMRG